MSHSVDIALSQNGNLQPRSQKAIVWIVLAILTGGMVALTVFSWRHSVLFVIGSLFGMSLYQASFGFASAYRKLFVYREAKGVEAQILMLGLATILFAPVLISGSALGQDLRGAIAPIGVPGAIGAFLFGIGMQLGSGCACGTLYTIGGGSSMMLITLLTFGIGSFWASLTNSLWQNLPYAKPTSLIQTWGWFGVAAQLAALLLIAFGLKQWQSKTVKTQDIPTTVQIPHSTPFKNFLFSPWSLVIGAIALAILNWLTLLIAGRPWGVTWGFTLWTAKIAAALGWNPATSEFWSQGTGAEALQQSVFADITSVMNFGIVLGAGLAAAIAGKLALTTPPSKWAIAAALIGGLLMGYGAWLAFGCNVGAYFSGIASTSLHGWLWITFALLGTAIGVKLRPWFQLSN